MIHPPLLLQIMLHWNTLNKYNFYAIKNVYPPWNSHSLKYSHMYSLNILSPWNNTLLIHPPLLPWNNYPLKYPKCIYIYPPWNNLPLKQSPMYSQHILPLIILQWKWNILNEYIFWVINSIQPPWNKPPWNHLIICTVSILLEISLHKII